ncbi:hypothetical protein [Yanshouia hominis]|uniref:Uncharacterized protein n=1 Tax=Yanshouia hominis TaxID=2763673 RepID=A0ABR7NG67_9FIRM|nr:hypothetical protein [Yanshouia hominis]MBC8575185.1 hypothetical protein [Yanshouia hominis]
MNHQIASDAVIQNLKDAGCEDDFIERFIFTLENQQSKEVFLLLRGWRNNLLDEIHNNQHKLDCLDYLIRTLGG